MTLSVAILALVTLQRLGELMLSDRNARRLLARGGVEAGQAHYPLLLGLNAAWLAGLWWLGWDRPANLPLFAVFCLLQGFRAWAIASLGERWTTRIITVPGDTPVARGPYRWFPHPNYAAVALEVAVLPLVFGLVGYAVVFALMNGSALFIRIRVEEAALREARSAPPMSASF